MFPGGPPLVYWPGHIMFPSGPPSMYDKITRCSHVVLLPCSEQATICSQMVLLPSTEQAKNGPRWSSSHVLTGPHDVRLMSYVYQSFYYWLMYVL
ncbi:hypothetical protein CEXT_602591 [Caerostris extrusa]|uniref:Uncharacterized protein n=1 Tax=Caerostris extrusa TaxID=172846 RepID=A0AAV4XJT4_CAEEX|nr:hypothetical protein CEXT_602591 [Caerostris extrusa]